jgi:DNA-binding MurR/RpiR family transcriptional regulator
LTAGGGLREHTAMAVSALAPRRDLVERLEGNLGRFSPSQRHLAEYVLRNYRDVAFMGVAELARATGVSPAAVVRFAVSLELPGYPALQRVLRAIVRSELRQSERFAASIEGKSRPTLAQRVLDQELENLAALRAALDPDRLGEAVRRIATAPRVAVVGFRAAATLAQYLWYNLRKVRGDVSLHAQPGSVTLEDLTLMPGETVAIFIGFPRYSRELVEAAELARGAGLSTVGITNNELSPLAPCCEVCLFAEIGEVSFTDFYAAPIALLNALIAEVAARGRGATLRRLTALDDLAAARRYLFPAGKRKRGS